MKSQARILSVTLLLLSSVMSVGAQEITLPPSSPVEGESSLPRWGVKTNMLSLATTSLYFGVEFKTGRKTSLDIPVSWNPWEFRDGMTKWKHILVQPELRFWLGETFAGHFIGPHAHYAFYNVSGLPAPPFTDHMHRNRFQGWLAGVGFSYGYRWNFNHRWAMEATVGIGYAYLDYDRFACGQCGEELGHGTKHYFGPTKLGLNLILGLGGKKQPAVMPEPAMVIVVPEPVTEPVIIEILPYTPRFRASFITPEAEAVKSRSESGRAYLEYAVGRSEIVPNFRSNAVELQKIHDLVRTVNSDPDATVTRMTLTGYASPEGTYSSNMGLSQRRAEALRTYLQGIYGFTDGTMSAWGAGEDWTTLGQLVEESPLPERMSLLDIIRSTGDYDMRERRLASVYGGVPYRQIKTEMYPKLRRTDYVLDYDVKPITVERGKEILHTRPGNLSLNEMFLIANTYAPGSDEFREVFDIAARVFPDSDVANINAAATALERGDTVSATRYLGKVRDRNPAWHNNMGILSALEGDDAKASEYFRVGGVDAVGNSAELEKRVRSNVGK